MPPMRANDYTALVGRRMEAGAASPASVPQMSMTGQGPTAAGAIDDSAGGMASLHRSPSTWYLALLVATAALARAAGFVRGR